MKFSELFTSAENGIFTVFENDFSDEFGTLFGDIEPTDLNSKALSLYGNKELFGYVTSENWEMLITTEIALSLPGWLKANAAMTAQYDVLKPNVRIKTKEGTEVVDMDDTDTVLNGNKPFNEDVFKDAERRSDTKTHDQTNTYDLTETVTTHGGGNVTENVDKEIRFRLKTNLQKEIMHSLVKSITLSLYM